MKTRKRKKTCITNKRRFVTFLSVLIILSCCGFSSVRNYVSGKSENNVIRVSVVPGDTLWKIAAENNPDKRDVRELVHEIKKYNNLRTSTIHVGDEIFIPV